MEFTSSSSSGRIIAGVNISGENDTINIDDDKGSRNMLPTNDEEINREHLLGHNRAKAMGTSYSYGGPVLSALPVDSLGPQSHLIMEDRMSEYPEKISSLDNKTKKLNVQVR